MAGGASRHFAAVGGSDGRLRARGRALCAHVGGAQSADLSLARGAAPIGQQSFQPAGYRRRSAATPFNWLWRTPSYLRELGGVVGERIAAAALALTEGIGWQTIKRLLNAFGTPQDVLKAKPEQLERLRGISAQVKSNLAQLDLARLTDDLARWRAEGIHYALWYEADYPTAFARLESRPLIVFWRGTALPEPLRTIAIVGTRQASAETKARTAQWSAALAERGWAILSGLARGVDIIAHRAAISRQGYSGAVLGCGLLRLYPAEHAALAARLQRNGFLLSEHAPDQLVRPDWLVLRNRLIAALCRAVIVMEAPAESGALHTARFAQQLGVPLFAVPNSEGNRALLATYAQNLPETPEAFLEMLQSLPYPPEQSNACTQTRPLFEE
ncbi:MAG: hypothetical protein CUN49_08905 [Candidatus Thermofonsia Clade 1 bacterium]|uniref:Smf/DprA SLOG domain-containing protein n=1 Tax=Candidatus Thermofonsia Clade 1 bacterium TaxID=2364210 RepID=A0A2M8PDY1_9CHLR|nr:MAG: hypothetical protein CUN49_08905 [Candidatus Thermofonsia Clade 1 bacterium]